MRVISGEARGHNLKAPKGMTTRPMADKIKGAVFSMLSNVMYDLDRDWGRVLDLYSGSGSIGIEALSRGATWADFVEVNAAACRVVSENLEHTKLNDRARVNNRTVQSFLNNPPAPQSGKNKRAAGGLHRRKGGAERQREKEARFAVAPIVGSVEGPEVDNNTIHNERQYDIIFLDPPYADPKIPDTLALVARSGLVKPGGLVIIGHSPRVVLQPTYGKETNDEETPQGQILNLLKHRRHGDSAFTIFLAGDPADYGIKTAPTEEELDLAGDEDDVDHADDEDIEEEATSDPGALSGEF